MTTPTPIPNEPAPTSESRSRSWPRAAQVAVGIFALLVVLVGATLARAVSNGSTSAASTTVTPDVDSTSATPSPAIEPLVVDTDGDTSAGSSGADNPVLPDTTVELPRLADDAPVITLSQDDFAHGTFIIDQPGRYQLSEDIVFDPNSPETLEAALASGALAPGLVTSPVAASDAGKPLFTQFDLFGADTSFEPGGLNDTNYDVAAYGIGFFAAISIEADDVELDLNGFTIEQSSQHALLQRFFAVIELADQPFLSDQGPAAFGETIDSAERVLIHNGTIGRSAHHGIHGNMNADVTIRNVDFVGYELAAVALNGVQGLDVAGVNATNSDDVPVLGTFSSATFIKTYVEDLVRSGSQTTLIVDGQVLTASDIAEDLNAAINDVHHDLIVEPNVVDGRAVIDEASHPDLYALFHNPLGVIDGNSYSFLTNHVGVAVNGFPTTADAAEGIPATDVVFTDVHVINQQAFVNEIPAIDADGEATIDPIGAVFQTQNVHPDTGQPVTISSLDLTEATYLGNVVANAQALVAKAYNSGDVGSGRLNATLLNISDDLVSWVEGAEGAETLADIGVTYICNGDSMFHVNKGVIGFKVDSAVGVELTNTSVTNLENLGAPGSTVCGDYTDSISHPGATLPGYGGAAARAYSVAGSTDVAFNEVTIAGVSSMSGSASGIDVLTDTNNVTITAAQITDLQAGWGLDAEAETPSPAPEASTIAIGETATAIEVVE